MKEKNEIMMFSDSSAFELAQRVAKVFAASQMVPKQFQGDISNCMIALNIANRLGADPFAVMQNMYIVQGRPAFSASFMLAMVNASRRFTPLRFEYVGDPGTDAWGCRVVSTERETGQDCIGTTVTIGMSKSEGWHGKNGSKWKTMPEQMLAYRAASFWARIYASDLLCGIMHTHDELQDAADSVSVSVTSRRSTDTLDTFTEQLKEPKKLIEGNPDFIAKLWLDAAEHWGDDHQKRLKDFSEEVGFDLEKLSQDGAWQVIQMLERDVWNES